MGLRKKATNSIKKALSMIDDKAEPEDVVNEEVEQPLMIMPPPLTTLLPINKTEEEQEKKNTMNDFAKLLNSESEDGLSVYGDDEPIGINVATILKKVTIGLTDWEYRFLAAYSLLPSLFCKILPIVEITGQAGTGKSQLLIAMSKISGNGIISGQSTGASLKNYINVIRWADPETKNNEKNCLLLIDNLNEDCFKKEEYLSSFLNGYSRATDRTFISNGKGQNIEFKTFCGKIYTTIWDCNSTELHRRTVTIRTHKVENLDSSLDPDEINWRPLSSAVNSFWGDCTNWDRFASVYKLYAKTSKPKHSKEYWVLLRDVIVTGVVTGVWFDLSTAIDETVQWLEKAFKTRNNLFDIVVLKALEEILGFPQNEWDEMSRRVKIHIAPRSLKDAIEQAVVDGLIERPKLTQIQQALAKFGFSPGKKENQLGYVFASKKKQ